MGDWYDEPGIKMLCDVGGHLASMARNCADRMADIVEQLPTAGEEERAELLDELEMWARSKREDSALHGAASVGDFLVMLDMSSMAWGLKPVGDGPGPVAEAGWKLQEQGPVFEAAKQAALEVLDGTGSGDLSEYYALIEDKPPPPAPGIPHLRSVE